MIRYEYHDMAKVAVRVSAIAALGLLAACGPKKVASAPPPPPPPPKVVIPARPTPPNGASPYLATPAVDADGLRKSVNRNISPAQMLWNLRSAYNVAALNCSGPQFADIVVNYRVFLKKHATVLTATNRAVDNEFRKRYGTKFIAPREKYMTEVYNHFATPPTLREFCVAVQAMAVDAIPVASKDLQAFAVRSLPNIEVVFDEFYRRYSDYKLALADWEAKWGAVAPAPKPVVPAATNTLIVPAVPAPVTPTPPAVAPSPPVTK